MDAYLKPGVMNIIKKNFNQDKKSIVSFAQEMFNLDVDDSHSMPEIQEEIANTIMTSNASGKLQLIKRSIKNYMDSRNERKIQLVYNRQISSETAFRNRVKSTDKRFDAIGIVQRTQTFMINGCKNSVDAVNQQFESQAMTITSLSNDLKEANEKIKNLVEEKEQQDTNQKEEIEILKRQIDEKFKKLTDYEEALSGEISGLKDRTRKNSEQNSQIIIRTSNLELSSTYLESRANKSDEQIKLVSSGLEYVKKKQTKYGEVIDEIIASVQESNKQLSNQQQNLTSHQQRLNTGLQKLSEMVKDVSQVGPVLTPPNSIAQQHWITYQPTHQNGIFQAPEQSEMQNGRVPKLVLRKNPENSRSRLVNVPVSPESPPMSNSNNWPTPPNHLTSKK